MKASLYTSEETQESKEVLELQTYFNEASNFEMNSSTLKFATRDRVNDLKEISLKKLKIQKDNFNNWVRDDIHHEVDLKYDFTTAKTSKEIANGFRIFSNGSLSRRNSMLSSVVGLEDYVVDEFRGLPSLTGCDLSLRLSKVLTPLNIRSRAYVLKLDFSLVDDSALNIITRSRQNNEETTVMKFAKIGFGEHQRLFLFLGVIDGDKRDIVYTKKTEIPILNLSENYATNNYLDVKCTIQDNGDEYLIITGEVNNTSKQSFRVKYEQLIPYFEEFNIYLLGERSPVIIRDLELKLTHREDLSLTSVKDNPEKCSCNIF